MFHQCFYTVQSLTKKLLDTYPDGSWWRPDGSWRFLTAPDGF